MTQPIFNFKISADGKLLGDSSVPQLQSGDVLNLQIDGNQLHSGESKLTLLGALQDYLPQSTKLELTHLEPMPNGSCQLKYVVCD